MFDIEFTRAAVRELLRLPRAVQARFRSALEQLRLDPVRSRPGVDVRPLRSRGDVRRLRVGSYRAIYALEGRTIVVLRVGHRSHVHRP